MPPNTAHAEPHYLVQPPNGKFRDAHRTATGEPRATVHLKRLETLWFCTGTLCNLECRNCYIESSPKNDALVYLAHDEVCAYLDEIEREGFGTQTVAFTGGEPFMNPDFMAILETTLTRGYEALVLTNAMKPMHKVRRPLLALRRRHGERLTIRVSIDHYTQSVHEAERGPKSWKPAMEGLRWLSANGFRIDLAGRLFSGETEAGMRAGYAALFEAEGIAADAYDPRDLVLFPEMDAQRDVPEITTACWEKVGTSPDAMMCATSRMVIKRKGAERPVVVPCTLLPYDPAFELSHTLQGSFNEVPLNHPHCAQFCVLGGASCTG